MVTYCYADGRKTLGYGLLAENTFIFTAEMTGICEAVKYATKHNKNMVIFSDSLSAIRALNNIQQTSNQYINNIKSILKNSKKNIAIAWVPPHKGIEGNKYADAITKQATNLPLIVTPSWDTRDTIQHTRKQFIKHNTSPWYTNLNPHIHLQHNRLHAVKKYTITKLNRIRL